MGRSLFTAAGAPIDPPTDKPFRAGRFNFQLVRQQSKLIQKEWCEDASGHVVAEFEAEIAYAVGSGTQARSHIWQRDGFLFQAPLTWYPRKSAWELSPGYESNLQHFSRRIDSRCLYCHCQDSYPIANTTNQYRDPPFGQLAIGCERCHGPGELHVARRKNSLPAEEVDYTIVNPKHLTPLLREAVCQQCHLQGEMIVDRRGRSQSDYRPGLPLHEYVSVFVRRPEDSDAHKIVNHVEQMQLSTCLNKSGGRFGCTSCHDPHGQPPAEAKIEFYRQRCANCHGAHPPATDKRWVAAPDCSERPAARASTEIRDNCLACHMPRNPSSNATHLAVTDHRVPRFRDRPPKAPAKPGAADNPLVVFHRAQFAAGDEELQRDYALALIGVANLVSDPAAAPHRDYLTRTALPFLDKAAERASDDVPVLEARGFALLIQGRAEEALKVLQDVLAKSPDREQTLAWAARAAESAGQLELAETYARRLTERYPYYAVHRLQLAVIRVKRRDWPGALDAVQAALKTDPFNIEARAVLVSVLFENGERDRAVKEFTILGAIDPAKKVGLEAWFAERLRRTR
jgi:hypothetical protein